MNFSPTLFSPSSTSVSLKLYDENFSDPDFVNDKSKFTYTISSVPNENQQSEIRVITDDADVTGDGIPDGIGGTLHMQNTSTSGNATGVNMSFVFPAEAKTGSMESVLMFDVMMPNVTTQNKSRISAMVYYGGVRHNSYFSSNSMSGIGESGTKYIDFTTIPGVWYTYMYRLNEDRSMIEIFRKLRTEHDGDFVKMGEFFTGDHNKAPSFMWVANATQQVNMYFDNVKLYNGMNILSYSFNMNGEKITDLSQIAEGELEANVTLMTNKEISGTTKVFVAYDSRGKLLGCTVIEEQAEDVVMGTNEITALMELDSKTAETLADGGYVGLYVWDVMYPIMEPLELM